MSRAGFRMRDGQGKWVGRLLEEGSRIGVWKGAERTL